MYICTCLCCHLKLMCVDVSIGVTVFIMNLNAYMYSTLHFCTWNALLWDWVISLLWSRRDSITLWQEWFVCARRSYKVEKFKDADWFLFLFCCLFVLFCGVTMSLLQNDGIKIINYNNNNNNYKDKFNT